MQTDVRLEIRPKIQHYVEVRTREQKTKTHHTFGLSPGGITEGQIREFSCPDLQLHPDRIREFSCPYQLFLSSTQRCDEFGTQFASSDIYPTIVTCRASDS